MGQDVNFGKLLHGGDYNPEQWLDRPDILEQDIQYFKEAKINQVSIGIFSWSMLEPEEGVYNFGWMEGILDRLYQNGIFAFLATPSGARPKWMADKYSEVLRVDENRHRNLFGARHNHCYTSPIYREKVRAVNMELSRRFGNHPGVIAWHISNEYGGECHCPLCQAEFQNWLKEKYKTIDGLNKAWAAAFWSHLHQDFSQVESPSPRGEMTLHGLNLDWKRFVTDRTVDFVRHEVQAVRDGGSKLMVTINMMYDYEGLNYHKFKDVVDMVSWDTYPTWHKGPEHLTALDNGMQHDIMRSILKKPYLMMESCPSATNWQQVSKLKRPGMLKAASLQAIAHGCDSVQYFQLRQSQGSCEKFHGAVIDHYGGRDTRVFAEVGQVGSILEGMSELAGSQVTAKAAVVYDWENRWAMEDAKGPRNKGLFYKKTVEKSHHALRRMGLNVDVIDMEQGLDSYQIVAVPMLYMFRAGFEKKAEKFVRDGGRLLLTYWSGIVDETDLCFLGGTPHGLMDVMGLRSTEIDALYDDEENRGVPVPGNFLHLTREYCCRHLCDLVEVDTAQVLMRYGEDFYGGMPAFTCNSYGKGKAYYICADFEMDFYEEICLKIAKEAGIYPVFDHIPQEVEVSSRETEEAEYLFVQNFSQKPVEIEILPKHGSLWMGEYDGTLKRLETVVLKRAKMH